MKIDWKHLIAPAVALVIIALVVSAYVHEREDRLRAELTGQLTQQSIDARDKSAAEQIQALKDLISKVKTPEDARNVLPQLIQLPAPIVKVEATTPAAPQIPKSEGNTPKSEGNSLPDAAYTRTGITQPKPGDYVVPAADLPVITARLAQCKQDEISLTTCQQDLKDVKAQRDAADTALKGGTFFTRLKRNAKWFAIGGAVGAGGILATRR